MLKIKYVFLYITDIRVGGSSLHSTDLFINFPYCVAVSLRTHILVIHEKKRNTQCKGQQHREKTSEV